VGSQVTSTSSFIKISILFDSLSEHLAVMGSRHAQPSLTIISFCCFFAKGTMNSSVADAAMAGTHQLRNGYILPWSIGSAKF